MKGLKRRHRAQKLSDGKTIGGAGRLMDALINSLQNYYSDVIQRNKGDIDGMMRGVQATLLHSNSTDEVPHHHLCHIYAQLGSSKLLEKCLDGYTQNANESLHSII